MSSMTRVMQKIREDAQAGEPADVLPEASAGPTATEPREELSAPVSAFVEEPPVAAATPSVPGTPLDGQTASWDRQQIDPAVIAFHDRYSPICERYRAVRARLMNVNGQRRPQLLVVTSSVPQEGKSVSTLNLGLIMAEGGEHRILIADADLRRPSLAQLLGVSGKPGLADVLRGGIGLEEALQPTPMRNLRFLPAGDTNGDGCAELLGSSGLAATLKELRTRFDYVLLDTPPVTTVSDVCLLGPWCDGAIVVVRMCRTPEPAVQRAVRTLRANKVAVLGCLLSHARDNGAEGDYGYYASSHGGRR